MKLNLDTVILYVNNLEQLKSFYTEILGLKILEDDRLDWVLLSAGNASIGLHEIGKAYRTNITQDYKFDNNTKLVFEIQDDIHTYRQALINKKVLMKEVKTFDNYPYWLCDGIDPEGNVFQLKQRKLV